MAAVDQRVRRPSAELPDILISESAGENFRGLWSKYRPQSHRRESHDFPDRVETGSEEEVAPRRQYQQQPRRRQQRQRQSSPWITAEEDAYYGGLTDLIPKRSKANRRVTIAGTRPRVMEPLAGATALQRSRRRSDLTQALQSCEYCDQLPAGPGADSVSQQQLKLQGARDRQKLQAAADQIRVSKPQPPAAALCFLSLEIALIHDRGCCRWINTSRWWSYSGR